MNGVTRVGGHLPTVASGGDELVAHAADREDPRRPSRFSLDLPPQADDVRVADPLVADVVAPPQLADELASRERSSGLGREQRQEPELRRRQLDEPAVDADLVADAVDRREAEAPVMSVGGLAIDRVRHEVHVDGRLVELTPSEFRLLALLASEPGRAFTRRELVRELWRSDYVGDERICDTHVVGLRRKVERDPARPARILAVRGVGYKLVAA